MAYFNFTDQQAQQKFWMLGAIDAVLRTAIETRLQQGETPVDVAQCSDMFVQLMRQQGQQQILTTQSTPQLGKIFVMLLVLDNLQADATPKWPSIFTDLMGLVEVSDDFAVQKLYMRFIVKTLLIFEEEVVERLPDRPAQWTALTHQIKDFVRQNSIQ